MARTNQPGGPDAADAIQQAVAAASAMLIEQMEALNAATLASLSIWNRDKDVPKRFDYIGHYLTSAVQLAEASARLGETLAKMKGESRQRISVERLAAPLAPASIEETLSSREALIGRRNSQRSSRIEGEGEGT